jgi:hypothetical protein
MLLHISLNKSCMSIKQLYEDHISVSHITSNTQSTKHTELSGLHLGQYSDTSFTIRCSDMSVHKVNKSGDIHVSSFVTCYVPNVRSIHWMSGTWWLYLEMQIIFYNVCWMDTQLSFSKFFLPRDHSSSISTHLEIHNVTIPMTNLCCWYSLQCGTMDDSWRDVQVLPCIYCHSVWWVWQNLYSWTKNIVQQLLSW